MSKIKSSTELTDLYEAMDDQRKQSLSDFADFLYAQADPVSREIPPPVEIPRPQKETVVGAIKRLKETYHMVGSMSVFSAASSLMTEHMVKGRDVVEVIDEMEALFIDAYDKLVQENTPEEARSEE
ncbi:MAG TPA: Crp/Fnr family transcriptional regulator [Gammaproteobacteria bacterium]|nr:Crp/Fnr family transcriptional regulator [Gammaproteobacteria bacterium]